MCSLFEDPLPCVESDIAYRQRFTTSQPNWQSIADDLALALEMLQVVFVYPADEHYVTVRRAESALAAYRAAKEYNP